MIISILFIFLFLFTMTFILVFLFDIMLPAMKAEKIGIQNPVFSIREIQYVEKNSEIPPSDLSRNAVVAVNKNVQNAKKRLSYDGLQNCSLFFSTYESEYADFISCPGFGDCVKVCPQHAISIQNGQAVIDRMCSGCGICVPVCPKKFISLQTCDKNNEIERKKDFKFWYTCYRIITRSN
jgi:Na+-translocating ferredoxin:NAD+ oxidoreductase subunit B